MRKVDLLNFQNFMTSDPMGSRHRYGNTASWIFFAWPVEHLIAQPRIRRFFGPTTLNNVRQKYCEMMPVSN